MSNVVKKRLDPITLLYGIGASIVLVGAMFKFVGWAFANELFIIGLSIEAVIFFISAFEMKKDEREYAWEEVFPQLDGDSSEGLDQKANMAILEDAIQSFSKRLESMESDLDHFRGSVGNSGASFDNLSTLVKQQTELVEELNAKLNKLNDQFGKL
jgi:gliding motility-associated protein GldL